VVEVMQFKMVHYQVKLYQEEVDQVVLLMDLKVVKVVQV
jgi:hypothetical protein